jgi:methyl coenzyme M reductase subunit D
MATEKVDPIVLEGNPIHMLHLPVSDSGEWIVSSVHRMSSQIRLLVDDLYRGTDVLQVVTHGPGMALPAEYQVRSAGNVSGLIGVTLQMSQGQVLYHTETYSTIGGSPSLERCNPTSAPTLLMQSLRAAKKALLPEV